MQDILMKLWTSADPDRIFKILTAAMTELEKTDQRQEYNADIFIDYISFIASEHLSGNRRQIEEGSWNEKAGLAENFMREHLPVTYISWLFSDNPVEEVFLEVAMSRRVMITGIVDTDIYKGDVFVNSVSKEGDVTSAAKNQKEQDAALPNLAVMRLGDVTTLNLPADNEYSILLHVDSLQPVFIDDVLIFSGIQQEIGDTAGIYTLDEGDYELYYDPESGEPTLTALSGRIITKFTSLYSYYSTALSMAEESNASDHITIISALTGIMLFLFLLCLIAWS